VVFPEKLNALLIVIGVILLLLGRRAYLISVGILGFLGGLYLFTLFIGTAHDWRSVLFALLFGTVGSLLAFSLHKAAWIFGGFCGGGVLLLYLNDASGIGGDGSPVMLFVVGGAAGAAFFLLLLDWALIVVTSIMGAVLIAYQSRLEGAAGLALFALLLLTGMLVQGSSLRSDRKGGEGK
jgi:hypothetical protein